MGIPEFKLVLAGGTPAVKKMITASIANLQGVEFACFNRLNETLSALAAGGVAMLIIDANLIAYALPKSLLEIKANNPDLQIVLLHTEADLRQELELFALPVADVLTKYDINPRCIRRLVSRLFHQYHRSSHSDNGSKREDFAILPNGFGQQTMSQEGDVFFCSIANVNPSLVWRSDPRGERIFFNNKWLKFRGRSLAQECGKGWLEGIYPPHLEKVKLAEQKAIENRQNYHVDYRLKASDGNYRWILESGSAQFGSNGQFIGFIGWCTDINETRLTQQKLSGHETTSGERHAVETSTSDHAPLGMWKLNENLAITKANPAASDQLGLDRQLLIGKNFLEVAPFIPEPALRSVIEGGARIQLQNQQVVIKGEQENRLAYLDIDAWPLVEDERIVGIGMSTIEVTDRKLQDERKEDFVATLVHDLKTPLIGADYTIESLLNGVFGNIDPGQCEALSMLRQSNRQLLAMVQNLIEAYRYESGNQRLILDSVSVLELVRNAIKDLSMSAVPKKINLVESLPENLGTIIADRLAMRRVLQNLLSNAIKFTPEGGLVKVTGETDGDFIWIHVTDNGCGISDEDQKRLFSRFYQSEERGKFAAGTGLGLYLCKQIIDAHKGQLSCSSVLNHGTTFSIKLPR